MKIQLRAFVDAINNAGTANKMNLNIGMAGAGQGVSAIFGGASSSQDILLKLHKTTNAFAGTYASGGTREALAPLAQEIGGHIFMLQTLGVITEESCQELTAQLDELMAAKQ